MNKLDNRSEITMIQDFTNKIDSIHEFTCNVGATTAKKQIIPTFDILSVFSWKNYFIQRAKDRSEDVYTLIKTKITFTKYCTNLIRGSNFNRGSAFFFVRFLGNASEFLRIHQVGIAEAFKVIGIITTVVDWVFSVINLAYSTYKHVLSTIKLATKVYSSTVVKFQMEAYENSTKPYIDEFDTKIRECRQEIQKLKHEWMVEGKDNEKELVEKEKHLEAMLKAREEHYEENYIIHKAKIYHIKGDLKHLATTWGLNTVSLIASFVKFIFKVITTVLAFVAIPSQVMVIIAPIVLIPISLLSLGIGTIINVIELGDNLEIRDLNNDMRRICERELKELTASYTVEMDVDENGVSVLTEESVKNDIKQTFLVAMIAKHKMESNFYKFNIATAVIVLALGFISGAIGVVGVVTGVILIIVFPPIWVLGTAITIFSLVLMGVGVSYALASIALKYGLLRYYKPNEFKETVWKSTYTKLVFAKALSHLSLTEKGKKYYKDRSDHLTMRLRKATYADMRLNLSRGITFNKKKLKDLIPDGYFDKITPELEKELKDMKPGDGICYYYHLMVQKDWGGKEAGKEVGAKLSSFTQTKEFVNVMVYLSSMMQVRKELDKKKRIEEEKALKGNSTKEMKPIVSLVKKLANKFKRKEKVMKVVPAAAYNNEHLDI